MRKCSLPTHTCSTGKGESAGVVRGEAYWQYENPGGTDRTAPVCVGG